MTSAIKRIHNLPPHLSCVSTLPDIIQNPKSYVVFLSVMSVALKRTSFDVSEMALKRAGYVVCLDHSRCSKWCPFAFAHAHSRVCRKCHFLRSTATFGSPGEIATKTRDAASRTDLYLCAKLQPNAFSSLGRDVSQTDRHTEWQTDSETTNLVSPPNYRGGDNK